MTNNPMADLNRASYDAIAGRWDAVRVSFQLGEQRYLESLLQGLPPGASVLDAGCGTGRPMAESVLARGHRVTGVDQSREMLALARERFPRGTWVLARLEEYGFPGRHDAVVCWDSLFHVDRALHERILGEIHACLAPGGSLMLTVGGSEHPAFTDTMFGEEFFYDSHAPDRVLAMLGEIGFELAWGEYMNPPTGGRDKGRYALMARKRVVAG